MKATDFIAKLAEPLKSQAQEAYDAMKQPDPKAVTFTLDSFNKKKQKATDGPRIETVKDVVEDSALAGNAYKAILELTNQEIKDKFGKIEDVNDWLNKEKVSLGLEPDSDYKSYSKKFFEDFREVMLKKMQSQA